MDGFVTIIIALILIILGAIGLAISAWMGFFSNGNQNQNKSLTTTQLIILAISSILLIIGIILLIYGIIRYRYLPYSVETGYTFG